jgi:tRNA(fMet)-specific endonuclease VapC
MPFTEKHINTLSKLKIAEGHNDPFDHSIISHAITDKLILVSSDKQFENYRKQNLNFAFNKR